MASIENIFEGAFIMILGIVGVVVAWNYIPSLMDLLPDSFTQGLFWVGLIIFAIIAIIIAPVMKIMGGKQERGE